MPGGILASSTTGSVVHAGGDGEAAGARGRAGAAGGGSNVTSVSAANEGIFMVTSVRIKGALLMIRSVHGGYPQVRFNRGTACFIGKASL